MGMLRLLTSAAVMGGAPRTIAQAWEIYRLFHTARRLIFANESSGVESVWRQLMTQSGVGPSSWTDAYLAAFARTHSCTLITFDAAFVRWPDLDLKLLSATAGH